jgi:hypothetical protein
MLIWFESRYFHVDLLNDINDLKYIYPSKVEKLNYFPNSLIILAGI